MRPGPVATARSFESPVWGRIFSWLLVLVPLGVLGNTGFMLLKTDFSVLTGGFKVHGVSVALVVVLGLLPWFLGAWRLLIWMRFFGLAAKWTDPLAIVIGTELGSAVTPTAIGGGYVKLGLLVERGLSPGASTSLMTLGTLEDGLAFLLTLPAAFFIADSMTLPYGHEIGRRLAAVGVGTLWLPLCLVALAGAGFFFSRRYPEKVHRLLGRLQAFFKDFRAVYVSVVRRGKWRFAASLGLAVLQWAARYTVVSALFSALSLPADPFRFYVYQWMVFTLGTLFPTPGGIGGVEAAFMLLFQSEIPGEMAALVTALWRFFMFYFQLILGSMVFMALQGRPALVKGASLKTAGS